MYVSLVAPHHPEKKSFWKTKRRKERNKGLATNSPPIDLGIFDFGISVSSFGDGTQLELQTLHPRLNSEQTLFPACVARIWLEAFLIPDCTCTHWLDVGPVVRAGQHVVAASARALCRTRMEKKRDSMNQCSL